MSDPAVIAPDAELLTDAAGRLGVTYWRLDQWVNDGHLNVVTDGAGVRRLPPHEATVAALLVQLSAAGIALHAATRAARALATYPSAAVVDLGYGVRLQVTRHA
jgi:hypothetical protein